MINLNNVSAMAIRSVNHSRSHPLIVILTAMDIVFVLATAAGIETPIVVVIVIVPGSDVIPLPPMVQSVMITEWMSTGGWRHGCLWALSLMLTRLRYPEIKRILARVSEQPHPDVIVCIKMYELREGERVRGSPA